MRGGNMRPKSISTSEYIIYKQTSSTSIQSIIAPYQIKYFDAECKDENILPEDIEKKNNTKGMVRKHTNF
jgi:hypothetical protein